MTTDITELAQSLKAAAEKATPGRIGDRIDGSGSIKYRCFGNDGSLVLQADHKNMEYGFIGPNGEADELFFRECKPENILALVEALEKAQTERDEFRNRLKLERSILDDADKRIAELEARTVKLPHRNLGHPKLFLLCPFPYYDAEDMEKALAAAGIKVEAE